MEEHQSATMPQAPGNLKVPTDSDPHTSKESGSVALAKYYGFGDFCFARFLNFDDDNCQPRLPLTGFLGNVKFEELDGFERDGPFPFYKLPLELRNKIYEALLAPFLTFDPDIGADVVSIRPRPHDFGESSHYQCDYEQYLENNTYGKLGAVVVVSEAERTRAQLTFLENQRKEQFLYTPHPYRSRHYSIECDCRRPGPQEPYCTPDWSMMKLLRDLSQVSKRVRYEFAVAFWKRSSIECNEEGYNYTLPLYNFLRDRPATWSGIRVLEIGITSDYVNGYAPKKWAPGKRNLQKDRDTKKYEFMAKSLLNLEKLVLEFQLHDEEYTDLADGKLPWFRIFRNFSVSKTFQLNTVIYLDTDNPDFRSSNPNFHSHYPPFHSLYTPAHYKRDLHKQLKPRAMEFMMPRTLRQKSSSAS